MLFFGLNAIFLLLLALMYLLLKPANDRTPRPLHALTFAPDTKEAAEIAGKWGETGRRRAAFALRIDMLCAVAYASALVLGCQMARDGFAERGWSAMATLSILIACLAIAARLFDVVENWGQLHLIAGRSSANELRITGFCTRMKFTLGAVAAFYVVASMAILQSKFFT
jgi:hypothetical protein